MSNVKLYTSISDDFPHYVYKEPVENKNKSRTAYVVRSEKDDQRPRYQMASSTDIRLKAPYGISEPLEKKSDDVDRKSLDLTIESDALLKQLELLDQHNIKVAHENCERWFKKKMTIDHIGFAYTPLVRPDKSGKGYKQTFRTKVNLKAGSEGETHFFLAEEVDGKMTYVRKDHSILTKGCRCVPIIDIKGLWFSATGFGMVLDCTDVIVFQRGQREDFPFQIDDTVGGSGDQVVRMETDDASASAYVPPSEPIA